MNRLILGLVSFVLVLGLIGAGQSWSCDIIVPDDYDTVQDAIQAATAGDTICIRNGTYADSALYYSVAGITKSLTLQGLGEDVIFDCGGTGFGIRLGTAGLSDVTVDGIKITNCESGIVVEQSITNLTIRNCDVYENANYAFFANGTTKTISDLAFYDVSLRDTKNYEGFFLETGNTVNDLEMKSVDISNNNEFGFVSYGAIDNAILDGLTVQGNAQGTGYGFGLALKGTANNVTISNSLFSNNKEFDISLGFWGGWKKILSTNGLYVENCIFKPGALYGSVFIDSTTSGANNVFINYNNFERPLPAGIVNNVGIVDGKCNWWDSIDGPSGLGPGLGVAVNSWTGADVNYEPWLVGPFPDGMCYGYDEIGACMENPKNHGKFVSCVAKAANNLMKDGIISGREKGAIVSWAAQADIP